MTTRTYEPPITPLYQRLNRAHLRTFWETEDVVVRELENDFLRKIKDAFQADSRSLSPTRCGREAYRVGPFLQLYMMDVDRPQDIYVGACNTGFIVPLTRAAELWLLVNAPVDIWCALYQNGRPLTHETV